MKKKKIITLVLTIFSIILIIVGGFMLLENKSNTNNSSNSAKNKKENNSSNQKTVKELDPLNDKKNYCYRHFEEERERDGIKYIFTKYYMFISNNDKIKNISNTLVSVYKFNSIDDLNNFNIDNFSNSSYSVEKDETNMIYTMSTTVAIGSEDKKIEDYDLNTYIELLKGYEFKYCEQKD